MECIECPPAPIAEPSRPPIDRGIAGASARREHVRRAAKREEQLKSQWGDRVGGWVTGLSSEPQSTRAWAVGAAGEERLDSILRDVPGIEVLSDRRVPGKRSNIDHLVIAPAGIFVVDAKHYQGEVRIRRRGSFFRPEDRLYVGRWDRTRDVDGVKTQVAVVENVLQASPVQPKPTVTPVLCFIDAEWPWFGAAKTFDGVYLESERSIKKLLVSSADFKPGDVDRLARELSIRLPAK
jgi:hypothetical protein